MTRDLHGRRPGSVLRGKERPCTGKVRQRVAARMERIHGRGLALVCGLTVAAIKNALPAFGASRGRPVRAVTACRLCTAARRIPQPVPVHLPAHHQACLTHGTRLSGPGTPQFSIRGCPDILAAERQVRGLLRRCTSEQLIHARIQAAAQPGGTAQISWKQQMHALTASNPRAVIESCPRELFTAAGYPETVTTTAKMIRPGAGT